jgi:dTDP-4-amino-4,6-dideoxygalactose transaminase
VSVDLYGSVADGRVISDVCARHDVPLVQDAAESIGARRDGRHAGRDGAVSILSFNGNKMVTTGGGGAIVSDDVELVAHARYLSTQARQPVPWYEHEHIGFNYRMGNLNAAVGRGQLRTLEARIAARRAVRERYEERLGAHPGIRFQRIPRDCSPNHWLTTVMLDPVASGTSPAVVLDALRSVGIEARHAFKPMHLQPVFAAHEVVGGSVAAAHFAQGLSLPSGSRMSPEIVDEICDVVIAATRPGTPG